MNHPFTFQQFKIPHRKPIVNSEFSHDCGWVKLPIAIEQLEDLQSRFGAENVFHFHLFFILSLQFSSLSWAFQPNEVQEPIGKQR